MSNHLQSQSSSPFGYDLVHALSNYDKLNGLPPNNKQAILSLAHKFQEDIRSHLLSPEELTEVLGGSQKVWRQFLTLKPVQDYIARKTQEDVAIMHRQALARQAIKAAETGDNQAAKFIRELYEAGQESDNKTTIILHYIPRPTAGATDTNEEKSG